MLCVLKAFPKPHTEYRTHYLFLHSQFQLQPLGMGLGPDKACIDQPDLPGTEQLSYCQQRLKTTQQYEPQAYGIVHGSSARRGRE